MVDGRRQGPASVWERAPRFGVPLPAIPVVIRPSVYGLVSDAQRRVAIVRAPDGVFLPGGGIDEGESPEAALCREVEEECGWTVHLGSWRERAVQFALSAEGSAFYEKRSEFFEVAIDRDSGAPLETGHETLWVAADEARALLTHESHAWAIDQFLESRGPHLPASIPRPIVGFHQDEEGHWVADLACGHTQHVRHDPPWQNRPWVLTAAGRDTFIGVELPCRKCVG